MYLKSGKSMNERRYNSSSSGFYIVAKLFTPHSHNYFPPHIVKYPIHLKMFGMEVVDHN
jgi:hypothetical protein